MKKACRGCGLVVVWRLNPLTHRPEPYDEDGSSHFGSCANVALFRPPEPGEEAPSPWEQFNYEESLLLQREALRLENETSGVRACRDNRRDARDGDLWCRSCYQPRPQGFQCAPARFDPKLRYVQVGDEVKGLRGRELAAHLKNTRASSSSRKIY